MQNRKQPPVEVGAEAPSPILHFAFFILHFELPSTRRRGFSLPELIIALTLLGAATAVMLPLMFAVSNQRRAADQRQLALLQAENALDLLLSAAKPEATEADLLRQWTEFEQPVSAGTPTLRELERRVIVTDRPQDQARQLTVELRWKNHAGHFTTPVRLAGWQFPPPEAQP